MPIPFLWERLTCNDEAAAVLARELKISPAIARLLAIRGIDELESAQRFLRPSLDHLHDPFRLADMAAAVERILAAIERKERIAIHGDYDCDGITSTVILRRALELFGANVIHFLPDRIKDGYGLQPETFDRLQADGVTLVISVDCGIRGIEAAKRARELRHRSHHHGSPRARCRAAGRRRRHQPAAPRLRLSRQEPRGRRRGAEARAGPVS